MNNFKPLSQPLLKIFSIAELHHAYWKEFCDACYAHFGFETNEIRTYEQKYETFCRCKCFITEEDGYEEKHARKQIGKSHVVFPGSNNFCFNSCQAYQFA